MPIHETTFVWSSALMLPYLHMVALCWWEWRPLDLQHGNVLCGKFSYCPRHVIVFVTKKTQHVGNLCLQCRLDFCQVTGRVACLVHPESISCSETTAFRHRQPVSLRTTRCALMHIQTHTHAQISYAHKETCTSILYTGIDTCIFMDLWSEAHGFDPWHEQGTNCLLQS